jgi:DNA-binding transcriptional MerR regulator
MAQQQPARRKAQPSKAPVSIPDKLYFRIGDVARLCSLPAYVLRFWETEFPQLKPNKGGTGQRLYRKRDVEMVLEIKHLLYDEGFTIAGARRLLTEKRRSGGDSTVAAPLSTTEKDSDLKAKSISKTGQAASPKPVPSQHKIKALRDEMRELLTLLGSDQKQPKSDPPAPRRDAKKAHRADEPTLF